MPPQPTRDSDDSLRCCLCGFFGRYGDFLSTENRLSFSFNKHLSATAGYLVATRLVVRPKSTLCSRVGSESGGFVLTVVSQLPLP